MRGKMYQSNNFITKTVEENDHTIKYTTEETTVVGQIFAQTCNFSKVIKKFGNKELDAALEESKQLHNKTCFRSIDANKLKIQEY